MSTSSNSALQGTEATPGGDAPTPRRRFGALLGLWLVAVSLALWAARGDGFRDQEGEFRASACFALAGIVAAGIAAAGWNRPLRSAAFWAALAVIGQAAALQLIDAGHAVHYQHYRPLSELVASPTALGVLLVQAAAVGIGLWSRWATIWTWLRDQFRPWQLGAIAVVLILTSATVSRDVSRYLNELWFATAIQTVNLANLVLFAWALPESSLRALRETLGRWLTSGPKDASQGGIDAFAWAAAVWVTVLAAVLCLVVYQRHPHVADEVIYLTQARYFARGLLQLPPPPVPSAFDLDLMFYGPHASFSPFPPGWPAALAIAVRLGIGWLLNPLLAGVNLLLIFILLRKLYDRGVARMGVLLLAASPWYIFMAMSFMAHTFTLTVALVAALGVIRARETGQALWGWMGGAALGVVSLARPLEAVCLGLPLGLWALGLGGQRLRMPAIVGLILGAIAVGSLNLPYNRLLTGKASTFPVMAYFDKYYGPHTNDLGFGPERGVGWQIDPFPGHSPLDAMVNANLNGVAVNIELFGWSVGSLLFATVLLFSGKTNRSDRLMLAVIAAVVLLHGLYWFSGGPDFGARYWYLTIVPAIALTARGTETVAHALGPHHGTRVYAATFALCLLALVTFFPWRAVDKYRHYLGMRPDIRELAADRHFGHSLVLIRGARYPDYASAAAYNPVDLRDAGPLYAWNRDAATRAALTKVYPDREYWMVNGPTITGGGYRVEAGPLSAGAFLERTEADSLQQTSR